MIENQISRVTKNRHAAIILVGIIALLITITVVSVSVIN